MSMIFDAGEGDRGESTDERSAVEEGVEEAGD